MQVLYDLLGSVEMYLLVNVGNFLSQMLLFFLCDRSYSAQPGIIRIFSPTYVIIINIYYQQQKLGELGDVFRQFTGTTNGSVNCFSTEVTMLEVQGGSTTLYCNIFYQKIWALRAHPSSSCRGLGALRAPWGPAGPAGGLRPPVGLQYPNFEL